MPTNDLQAYQDYRLIWQGQPLTVLEAEIAEQYPAALLAKSKINPMHYEILSRFCDATAGVEGVTVTGGDWAEDPSERIVEALNIARMTGFCALSLGWENGKPRLDVAWGDQVTASPDFVRTLQHADRVAVVGTSGLGVAYDRDGDTWTATITRKDLDPEPMGLAPGPLPVLAIYDGRNRPDTAIPEPRRTLLDQQLTVDMIATDIEHQRHNSPAQIWIQTQDSGATGRQETVNRGPEFILELEAGETTGAINSGLQLGPQADYLDRVLQTMAVTAGLSPTTFLPSRAETGAAKAEESSENTRVRRRNHGRAVIQCSAIQAWLQQFVPGLTVTVPPFLLPSSGDPLQTASALELRWKMGLDSPIEQAIAERGLSQEDAVRFVARNQASYRTFGGGTLTPPERQDPDGTEMAQTSQP